MNPRVIEKLAAEGCIVHCRLYHPGTPRQAYLKEKPARGMVFVSLRGHEDRPVALGMSEVECQAGKEI